METYMYQASLYCDSCAAEIKADLEKEGKAPKDLSDENSYDSDDYPIYVGEEGGGESDTPQHCDACECFLENELTSEGNEYVLDALARHFATGEGRGEVIKEWADLYVITLSDLFDRAETMSKKGT